MCYTDENTANIALAHELSGHLHSLRTFQLFSRVIGQFRFMFRLNVNIVKHHKMSHDTLNGYHSQLISNISYVWNHRLLYEVFVGFMCSSEDSIQCFVSLHV